MILLISLVLHFDRDSRKELINWLISQFLQSIQYRQSTMFRVSVSPLESPSSPRLPIPEFSLANEGYSLSSLHSIFQSHHQDPSMYLKLNLNV